MSYIPQAQREQLRHYVMWKDEEQIETAEIPTSEDTNDDPSVHSASTEWLTTNSFSRMSSVLEKKTSHKGSSRF